jgi:hypothetical protein
MKSIIKPCTGYKEIDVINGGIKSFVSHEKILNFLKKECRIKEDEEIIGFLVNEDGIYISFKTIK